MKTSGPWFDVVTFSHFIDIVSAVEKKSTVQWRLQCSKNPLGSSGYTGIFWYPITVPHPPPPVMEPERSNISNIVKQLFRGGYREKPTTRGKKLWLIVSNRWRTASHLDSTPVLGFTIYVFICSCYDSFSKITLYPKSYVHSSLCVISAHEKLFVVLVGAIGWGSWEHISMKKFIGGYPLDHHLREW